MTFSKSSNIGESIQEFIATNPDMSLTVTKEFTQVIQLQM